MFFGTVGQIRHLFDYMGLGGIFSLRVAKEDGASQNKCSFDMEQPDFFKILGSFV
jgi:hypothetical protein